MTIADRQPTEEAAPGAPSTPGRAPTRVLVLAATAVSLALGLFQLGRDSFWVDDGFTVTHTALGNGPFWQVVLDHEMNGVAYAVFMHSWVRFGGSETWVRLPSVVFVAAAVPLLFALGRRLFDERVGLTACILLAVNAFVVEYAHEARTYAFTLLLATTSILLLVRLIDRPSQSRWAAWVLVTVLLGHAHFFGILVILAEAVAVSARGSLATPRRPLAKGFAVIAVLLLPIAWFLAAGGDKGQVDAAPSLTPVRFVGVFARLAGNGGPVLLALVGGAVAVAVIGGVAGIRESRGVRTERQWAFVLAVSWVAVPVLAVLVASAVKPLFGARYFVLVIPALALLASVGVCQIGRPRVAQGLLGAIVVTSLAATASFYPRPPNDDFRSVTAHVLGNAEQGDGIIFLPWFTRVTFAVYADRSPTVESRLDPIDPGPDWGDWLLVDQPPPVTAARADDLLAGHERIWVLERAGTDTSPQAHDLEVFSAALDRNGFRPGDQLSYPNLDLTLYERG